MEGRDTPKSTFLLKPFLNRSLQELRALDIGKYIKNLLVCTYPQQQKSLRNISTTLNDRFNETVQLDSTVASQRTLPPKIRLQTELLFNWPKQYCQVEHCRLSQQAVEHQVFVALITCCLLILLQLEVSCKGFRF